MLTEKRQEEIVRLVYERESITVAELKEILHSSESTIRRDIIALDQEGRLTKVFKMYFKSGGGITCQSDAESEYNEMKQKVYVPIY